MAFAALASAAIVTLAILPFLVWRGAARPIVWVAAAVAALALGLASFSAGGYAQRACTARYARQGRHHRHGTDGARREIQAARTQTSRATISCSMPPATPETHMDAAFDRPLQRVRQQHLFPLDSVPRRVPAGNGPGRPDHDTGAGPLGRTRAAGWNEAADAPMRYDVFMSYRHDGVDKKVHDRSGLGARSRRLPGGDRRAGLSPPMPASFRRWNDASARAASRWR